MPGMMHGRKVRVLLPRIRALSADAPYTTVPNEKALRKKLAICMKPNRPPNVMFKGRSVPSPCWHVANTLRACLLPVNRSCPFHVFTAALCRIINVLGSLFDEANIKHVLFCLLADDFTCLHWRAWALTDLQHLPQVFRFKCEDDEQRCEAFSAWERKHIEEIVGRIGLMKFLHDRRQQVQARLERNPTLRGDIGHATTSGSRPEGVTFGLAQAHAPAPVAFPAQVLPAPSSPLEQLKLRKCCFNKVLKMLIP